MFFPNCGTELPQDAHFSPHCGAPTQDWQSYVSQYFGQGVDLGAAGPGPGAALDGSE